MNSADKSPINPMYNKTMQTTTLPQSHVYDTCILILFIISIHLSRQLRLITRMIHGANWSLQ